MHPIYKTVEKKLIEQGFQFERKDIERPWGGFFVIKEEQAKTFVNAYFPNLPKDTLGKGQKVSPKILLVAPEKRLSWQYHFRRSEIWRVLEGEVGIVKSNTDEQKAIGIYQPDATIFLKQGERHRLIGLKEWGIVAEIWIHTNPEFPSDEEDIVRLQDDFERNAK